MSPVFAQASKRRHTCGVAAPSLDEIRKLPVDERIRLIEAIWDTIVASDAEVPLTDAQRLELERRIAAYKASPESGSSWEEVRRGILEDD